MRSLTENSIFMVILRSMMAYVGLPKALKTRGVNKS